MPSTTKKKPLRNKQQSNSTKQKGKSTTNTSAKSSTGKTSRGKASTTTKKESTDKGKASSKGRDALLKSGRKVVYPEFDVYLYLTDDDKSSDGPITVDVAKDILGWAEESENVKFKNEYLFKLEGKKIRCHNNITNRPFDLKLAQKWALEIIRGKWKLNGETIIIDKKAMIHDGQHRLVGLILAETMRQKNKEFWSDAWKTPCVLESVVIVGVDHDDDTINTINTGSPRTLSDVIYRTEFFDNLSQKDRKKVSRIADYALKGLWKKTGAGAYSLAPHMPHSESLDFISNHPYLLEAVKFIWEEEGGDRRVTSLLPLGTASYMMYLMAAEATDGEAYREYFHEDVVDFKLKDKAEEFWTLLAGGETAFSPVKKNLESVQKRFHEFPRIVRLCCIGIVTKAWQVWSEGKKITARNCKVEPVENEMGIWQMDDQPCFGGIDMTGVEASAETANTGEASEEAGAESV
jgi:hypothetical protein